MPVKDTSEIKEKIILFIKRNGPSLPIHIAKEIEQPLLFTSAFLSELSSEKKIRTSHMRIGSSPVYYLPGQEPLLSKFSIHLKSKEKEAYELLKEKKFLKDSEQPPAIRVSLRQIKDFAIPFEYEGELYWRFFITPPEQFKRKKEEKKKEEKRTPKETKLTGSSQKKKTSIKMPKKVKEKMKERFFARVKQFLSKKSLEIIDIIGFSRSSLLLIISNKKENQLLVAYDKKKITETDLLNAYKKSEEYGLPYTILCTGHIPKKIENLLQATKKLKNVIKLE